MEAGFQISAAILGLLQGGILFAKALLQQGTFSF
jgi:hypothetical protein